MHRTALLLAIMAWPTQSFAADWPQFRGPDGQGHSTDRNLPVTWSETANVIWKTPVPGLGWSSPAIQGKQIWLTTALDEGKSLRALCIDRDSGKLLHDVEVFSKDNPGSVHKKNSHASPTPILEGDRVYVHFGAHGTAALSADGEIVWKTALKYQHQHGPGGSPVLWNDLLIMSCDGVDVQFVVALDKRTGKIRWKQDRAHISEARRNGKSSVPMAYSTPLLIEVDGKAQVVSAGSDHVSAYDPATGEELWWFGYDGYSNVLRPVYGKGMIFVSSGYDSPIFYGVRVDGRGELTDKHVAWSLTRGAPLNPSPLLVGDELYLVSDDGIATCVDAETGEQHWQRRLGGNFSASPVYADGRIYFLNEDGLTTVIAPGKEYQELATNQIDGQTLASPATAPGAIFLRSDTHLYRIEGR